MNNESLPLDDLEIQELLRRRDEIEAMLTARLGTRRGERGDAQQAPGAAQEPAAGSGQTSPASQQHYQELFDLAPDAYLITGPDGVIGDANRAAAALLDTPVERLTGTRLIDYLDEQERPAFQHQLEMLRSGQIDRLRGWEVRLRPNGQRARGASITAEAGHGTCASTIYWLLRDTAEREQLLAQSLRDREVVETLAGELARERELLATIMAHTEAQLAYLDRDFRFVRVNPAYERGSGYSQEQLVGRNHFDLFPNLENQAIFQRVRDTGQPAMYRARPFRFPNRPERGATYWDWTLVPVAEEAGQVQGLVLSLVDVTERMRWEQEREAHMARLETLLRVSEEILAETSLEGVLARIADAACALTGAQIGVAGHDYREGALQLGSVSCADAPPSCPPGMAFLAEQGGIYTELLSAGSTLRLTDEAMRAHPAWWGLPDQHIPLRGLLGARLTGAGGEARGLIMVTNKGEGDFTAEDELLLSQLAALASLGLQHVKARDTAEQRAAELEAILDAAVDGIMVYDLTGVAAEANRAAAGLLGADPLHSDLESLLARFQIRDLDGRPVQKDELATSRALYGETVREAHYRLIDADGDQRTILASAAPLLSDGSLNGAVVIWHDLTELERLLEENRDQRAFLEQLMDAAPVAIAVIDPVDYRHLYVNPAYQAVPNVPGLPILGRTIGEVFPALAAQGILALLEPCRRGETVRLREYRAAVGPGREETYWNADCVPLRGPGEEVDRILVIADEVTDLVATRRQAETLAARYRAVLESMTEGVILFDPQGNLLEMNPAALRIHGFANEDDMRRHLSAFASIFKLYDLQGQLVPYADWPMQRILRGERLEEWELYVRRDGSADAGSRAWFASYGGTMVRNREGQDVLGVVTLRDVTARVEAEAALEAERARLEAIIENAPEGITVVDAQCRVTLSNRAAQRIYGRPVPYGASYDTLAELRLCYPDGTLYEARDLPLTRAAMDGEAQHELELGIIWPDGEQRTLLANVAPIRGPSGRSMGAVSVFQDVTERKRIEEQVRQYAERLRILHQIDQAILVSRSVEEMAEVILRMAPQLLPCRRAGVLQYDAQAGEMALLAVQTTGETAVTQGVRRPIPAAWMAVVDKLRQNEEQVIEDLQVWPLSGPVLDQLRAEEVRAIIVEPLFVRQTLYGSLNLSLAIPGPLPRAYLEVARELAGVLAVGIQQALLYADVERYMHDLEEMVRQRTAALAVSEARFRAVFEEAALGIAMLDGKGQIVASNPALQRMLGYSAEELDGRAWLELQEKGGATKPLAELLAGERSSFRIERRYRRRDGMPMEANVTFSLVHPTASETRFVVAMVEDVTERKQAQAALARSEQLAVSGQLAASLAHEINNPLQSVIGCLGLAEEMMAAGEDAHEYLQVAMEELVRASRVVHQLRDLNRPSEGQHEISDVNEMVNRVLLLTAKQARDRHVHIEWRPGANLPQLYIVRDRVRQVFLNMVLNAIDAMPGGGRLQVQTALSPDEQHVLVSFADSGVGIPEEAIEHLFEPFHSTKSEGLGLGLYVSHNVITEHGGRIEVQSRVGQGTTFCIWLPVTAI